MNIALGFGCLVAVAVLEGVVTGLPEQRIDTEDQSEDHDVNERPLDIQVRRLTCRRFGGKCIKESKDCPDGFPLETKPGKPYCQNLRRCCYPDPDIISFDEHLSNFNLTFENEAEELKRRLIFEDNVKKVQDHNKLHDSGKTSYRKGLNEYSHLTYEEVVSILTGFNASAAALRQASNEYYNPIDPGNEPCFIDWVNQGVLNPIKNQGSCGSCWAFSVTCVIESQIMLKNGVLQQLSEQYLVDCDSSNQGCNGGLEDLAIDYVIDNGIAFASGYPYTGKDGTCDNSAPKTSYNMQSEQSINPGNVKDLLNACVHIGPISVAIYVSANFQSYKSGILVDPECTTYKSPNHAVVLVGYGDENGQGYWLVRNSWGTTWGEGGYIKMSRSQHNICKISDFAVFPLEFNCASAGGERVNGKCLTFNYGGYTWNQSKDACASNGGLLASFYNTEAVYDYITTNHPGYYFWTGGNDIAKEGTYVWLDGRTFVPYPWYPNRPWATPKEGEPYRCIEVVGGAGYGDYVCSELRGYICEIV